MVQMYKFNYRKNDWKCHSELNFHSALASLCDSRGSIYKLIPIYCKYELKNITLLIELYLYGII